MNFNLRYKIWLEKNGKSFGDGPLELLKGIERTGSLAKAAREMRMSYSQAWNLLNTIEKRLGFKLVIKKVGGQDGGGSEITPEAREIMKRYEDFKAQADELLKKLFVQYFGEESQKEI